MLTNHMNKLKFPRMQKFRSFMKMINNISFTGKSRLTYRRLYGKLAP